MDRTEQLAWEAKWAKPAAAAAFLTAAATLAAIVLNGLALSDGADNDRELLRVIDENAGLYIGTSVAQGIGLMALMAVLFYLHRAVTARRPALPRWTLPLVFIGPVLYAVAQILSSIHVLDIARDFVGLAADAQTEKRAEDLREDPYVLATALGSGGTLALATSYVLVSVNAMRAGLLTRFMGIIGAIVGVLYVIPILQGPLIIQLFWINALGVLLLGHWPGGRGPAWSSGVEQEWPSGRQPLTGDGAERDVTEPEDGPLRDGGETQGARRKKRKQRR